MINPGYQKALSWAALLHNGIRLGLAGTRYSLTAMLMLMSMSAPHHKSVVVLSPDVSSVFGLGFAFQHRQIPFFNDRTRLNATVILEFLVKEIAPKGIQSRSDLTNDSVFVDGNDDGYGGGLEHVIVSASVANVSPPTSSYS